MSFSLRLTKHTFKYSFFTFHFNSLCDILCLHQHWGWCAEWQHETGTSQMCSLKNNRNSSVQKIRAMWPSPDSQSTLRCPNSAKLERVGGRPQNHRAREGGRPGQEASFPRFFKKKQAADFDCFGRGGEGENFYFWEWFFHSFTHKKLMEGKALFLTRGGGRGEKWPTGKKKRQIPTKMTSLGDGRQLELP